MGTELEATDRQPWHNLSANAKLVAFLDAQGLRSTEIARVVGVHEKSVPRFRRDAGFAELKAYWEHHTAEQLEPVIQRLRASAAIAHAAAIEYLLEAVTSANMPDSETPNHQVRSRAAEILVNMPIIKNLVGDRSPSGGVTLQQQTVTLVVRRDGSAEVVDHQDDEEAETVEADVEEEEASTDVAEEPKSDET